MATVHASAGGEPAAADQAAASRLGALRERDFRVLWIGNTVSNIGTWMHIVSQSWLMYQLTDSPLYLGLIGLTRAVPLLAFPLLGGVLADRVRRVRVLYVTQTLAMLLAAGLATLTLVGRVQAWHILVFSFLTASVLAFDGPARQALTPDLVSKDNLMSAMSYNNWSFNSAILIGPAIAAALLPVIGVAGSFYLNAVSFGAVLIALALLKVQEGVVPLGSARQNLTEGLKYVGQSPVILALVLMAAVVSLLGRSYGQLMPVFAHDFLGLDASGMSIMYTVAGLGAVVAASLLILLHNPKGKGRIALGSGLLFAAALAGFALSRSLVTSLALLFAMGFLLIAFSTSVSTLLQQIAPGQLRGRVMSVYTLSWQGLEYLGVMIVGGLATSWTTPPVVVGAAAVGAVMLGVLLLRREVLGLD